MANGVKVRGACPEGHITEVTAAPKRVTAYVECAHEGCQHKVNCKRIPRDAIATPTPDNPAEQADPHRVIRVPDHDQPSGGKPASSAGIVVGDPDVSTAGPPAGDKAGGQGGGGQGPKAGGQAGPPAAGPLDPVDAADLSRRDRLRHRIRAARSGDGRPDTYRHPLTG